MFVDNLASLMNNRAPKPRAAAATTKSSMSAVGEGVADALNDLRDAVRKC